MPVIVFSERAAPPLVSESNFVRIKPVIPTLSSNSFAMSAAFCPVIASETKTVSIGVDTFLISMISFIIDSSICKRPAVSTITVSKKFFFAKAKAFFAITTAFLLFSSLYIGTSIFSAKKESCSIAAGRTISQATSKGFFPSFFNLFASFAAVVVLPAPCNPKNKITD